MKMRFAWLVGCILLLWGVVPAVAQESDGPFLISEVMFSPRGLDADEEWIELVYLGSEPLDLTGYRIGDEETAGGGEGIYLFPEGFLIQPNSVIVVAQSAVAFADRYGFAPDFELRDTDSTVPDMRQSLSDAEGEITLSNSGDEVILLSSNGTILDAVNYGDRDRFFAPAVDIDTLQTGESIVRQPTTCDRDSADDWAIVSNPTPGRADLAGCSGPVASDTTSSSNTSSISLNDFGNYPSIGSIQGDWNFGSADGERVTTIGVVTALFQDNNAAGETFFNVFIQDYGDGNSQTSDGIPVFLAFSRPQVEVGDVVRVSGEVVEYHELTEFTQDGLEIERLDSDAPLPEAVAWPVNGCAEIDCETVESMRVAVGPAVVVGPSFETASGCGFSVMPVAAGVYRIIRHSDDTDIRPILPVLSPNDNACDELPVLKVGDVVDGLVGPLIYTFEQFRLVPESLDTLEITSVPLPTLPAPPVLQAGEISVISYNVENYFDLFDDTGSDAEPKPSAEQLEIKRIKLASVVHEVAGCPTMIAIQEVENEGLLLELADEIAPLCGFLYQVNHLESDDGRGIDNALLVNPDVVTINDVSLEQLCQEIDTGIDPMACPSGEDLLFSRPPFRVDAEAYGRPITVYVNHFKSKRGDPAETLQRRVAQAAHVESLVADQLAVNPDALVIVLGDLNDYADSPPLQVLTESGVLTNVLRDLPEETQYSFNFSGAAQLIDGLLLSPAGLSVLQETQIFHVNADFPEAWSEDFGEYRVYRAADHDIPMVVLQVSGEADVESTGDSAVQIEAAPTDSAQDLELESYATPEEPLVDLSNAREGGNNTWLVIVSSMIALIGAVASRVWRRL